MDLFRSPPVSQSLQSNLNGAGDVALVVLPAPDSAGVTPQKHSKLGLREPELLAVGFEKGWSHLPDPHGVVLHDDLLDGDISSAASRNGAVLSGIPSLPVGSGGVGNPDGLGGGFGLLGGFNLLPSPHGASGVLSVHRTFSRVRWAVPVADDTLIQRANGPVQNYFQPDAIFQAGA